MAITGWSGLFNNEGGETYPGVRNGKSSREQLRKATKGKRGARMRSLLRALTGSAPGSLAAASHTRVPGAEPFTGGNSGLVVPEDQILIERVTTSGDADELDAAMVQSPQPTYPVDASGNGGGGKLGF